MTISERSFEVAPARLFAVLVDPTTYPEWLIGAKKIRSVDANWPAVGSKFHHTVGFGPLALRDSTSVRDMDDGRMLELEVRARPVLEAVVRFEITATGTGCRLRHIESPMGPYKLIAPVISPLVKARNDGSLNRLAAIVERVSSTSAPSGTD